MKRKMAKEYYLKRFQGFEIIKTLKLKQKENLLYLRLLLLRILLQQVVVINVHYGEELEHDVELLHIKVQRLYQNDGMD